MVLLPLSKLDVCEADLSSLLSAEIRLHEAVPPLLGTASCHRAEEYTERFYLYNLRHCEKYYKEYGYDYLLWIHVIKVVLYKLDTCCKVCLIEFIWNIPAKRPKLAPLLHYRVQECNSLQERRPLWLS
jgi:hypothetical protein